MSDNAEITFLKEFLKEPKAETGDTCLNTIIDSLSELITIANTVPGTFDIATMVHIDLAYKALVNLSMKME